MGKTRQTRFSDVCGTVDELKRMLNEETKSASPETLAGFVEDCVSMLDRMEIRLREFQSFRESMIRLLEQMGEIGDSRRPYALQVAGEMSQRFSDGRCLNAEDAERLSDRAEEVRRVAGEMEQILRRFKETAMQVGRLYHGIEGGRGWDREGAEVAGMDERLAAWLPPAPHRERILDWLQKGRARLLPETEGPPVVQFEDGGLIVLSAVRYSDEIANFVPASFNPNPRAQLYRGRRKTPLTTEGAENTERRQE